MKRFLVILLIIGVSCQSKNRTYTKVSRDLPKSKDSLVNQVILNGLSDSFRVVNSNYSDQPYFERSAIIDESFQALIKDNKNDEVKLILFNNFPANFEELLIFYGYTNLNDTIPFLPFSNYMDHMDFYFSLFSPKDEDVALRNINLGLNGYWQSDGVGIFQDLLLKNIELHIDAYMNVLKALSNDEIESFFFFLFDGPHPSHELPRFITVNEPIYPEILKNARIALKRLNERSSH